MQLVMNILSFESAGFFKINTTALKVQKTTRVRKTTRDWKTTMSGRPADCKSREERGRRITPCKGAFSPVARGGKRGQEHYVSKSMVKLKWGVQQQL